MKELLIVSGKGGAGKTSISGCFAQLAENAVLVDCDVDAANLHMLLAPGAGEAQDFYAGLFPVVDGSRCTACGICADLCRFQAVDIADGTAVIADTCEGCGVCADNCPAEAVSLEPRFCGSWLASPTAWGTLFHAELAPGAENSGKLIAELRRAAKTCAEKTSASWIISDGPPGIGCPVISAATGVDFAVIVTEPTVSGIHDMKRLAVLLKQFEVPFALLINKADLNAENSANLRDFATGNRIPVIGEIPFAPEFSRALSAGKSVLQYCPETVLAAQLRQCWENLQNIISTSKQM